MTFASAKVSFLFFAFCSRPQPAARCKIPVGKLPEVQIQSFVFKAFPCFPSGTKLLCLRYILNLSTFKAAFNRHFLQKNPRFGQVIHIFALFGRVIHMNLWIMWIILMQSFRSVFNTRSFCSILVGFNKKIHNFPVGNHTADII